MFARPVARSRACLLARSLAGSRSHRSCPCSQDKNIKHNGNLKLDNIIEIARVMSERSCAKSLAGTCKEILGTCVSVGCTVEGAHPQEMITKVRPRRCRRYVF